MARGSGNKGGNGGRSKIRFIMLEADLSEGELDQVTEAIANALRPTPVVQRLVTSGITAPGVSQSDGAAEIQDAEVLYEEENDSAPEPRSKGPSKPRKYSQPRVMDDVDLEEGVSFPQFAASKRPKTLQDRYLIAAAWYRLHRDMDAITMHHVYTCFLHPKVKWPTSQQDFDQPLRQLVKADQLGRGERGHYVINRIGLAHVEMLGDGSE
jgi:hypothetical protein